MHASIAYCELCNVPCPGPESYNAHITGSKHNKVLALHRQMGKPIPPLAPVPVKQPVAPAPADAATVMGTPAMNFKDGGCLTNVTTRDEDQQEATATDAAAIRSLDEIISLAKSNSGSSSSRPAAVTQPIGETYIRDVPPGDGKPASFYCDLCVCPIGDRIALGQHLRGKRHRYQYKIKVDPTIEAEVFPKPLPTSSTPAPSPSSSTANAPLTGANAVPKSQQPAYQKKAPAGSASGTRNQWSNGNGYKWGNGNNGGGGNWDYNQQEYNNSWRGGGQRPRPPAGYMQPQQRYPPPQQQFAPGPYAPMSSPTRPYGRMPMSYRHPGNYPTGPAIPRPLHQQMGMRPMRHPMPEQMHMNPHPNPDIVFSNDDRLLIRKHSMICPIQDEVDALFHLLNTIEKALKLVSDDLMVPSEAPASEEEKADEKVDPGSASNRILKGLMRVGPAAKELLLRGDNEAHIVVICSEKPTKAMQEKVIERLAFHLEVS